MKILWFSFIILITSFNLSYSQDTIKIYNDLYVKWGGKWYVAVKIYNEIEGYRLLDEKHISVNFKADAGSIDSCLNFLASSGFQLKLIWKNPMRWVNFEVPEGTNVIELCLKLSTSPIIEYVGIDSFGELFITNPESILWSLYPNPAESYLDIHIVENIENPSKGYKVEIITVPSAKIVRVINLTGSHNRLNIQNISPGSYFVRITLNNKTYQKKLIIQR